MDQPLDRGSMNFIKNFDKWIPYKFSGNKKIKCLTIVNSLLERNACESFMDRSVIHWVETVKIGETVNLTRESL